MADIGEQISDHLANGRRDAAAMAHPWRALWVMLIGFFMILLDTTIVAVANPAMMRGLGAGLDEVLWVTSAYLLAYAVPLLITGRLGDRFGQRTIYLWGLAIFTLASLACGLAQSVDALVTARVVQGVGAALISPQAMAVITRVFPREIRGAAMGVWGMTAGVASLIGPILGGVLIDTLSWQWIFFINIPVGLLGIVLGLLWIPRLQRSSANFDWLGVVLSGLGVLVLVFGIQEGQSYDWGVVWAGITVPMLIAAGILLIIAFVIWQSRMRTDALVPLSLFRSRDFTFANIAILAVGFTVVALNQPLIFQLQLVYGMTPTQAALLLAPTAVVAGICSPLVGRLTTRRSPRAFAVAGTLTLCLALICYSLLMHNRAPEWMYMLPAVLMGLASSGVWGPISLIATRGLPRSLAGAGSGVFNAIRQFGSVLGSAAVALVLQSRIQHHLGAEGVREDAALPDALQGPFSAAMAESILLPAAVILLACAAMLALGADTDKHTARRTVS